MPLKTGPSLAAVAVIASVSVAAASMRTHRSHHGAGLRAVPESGLLINNAASTRAVQAATPATATSPPKLRAAAETRKNATAANARETGHLALLDAVA